MSPAPKEESLVEYYNSQLTVFESESSFDIKKRTKLLKMLCSRIKKEFLSYAEIGANNSTVFHDEISCLFSSIITIDVNESSKSMYSNIRECTEKADIIGAYFVFEHIVNLKETFSFCYDMLYENGYLIIEVPDVEKYYHYNHLIEIYEHVNHFTMFHLLNVGYKNGFSPVYLSRSQCSRDEGIVIVLQKGGEKNIEVTPLEIQKQIIRYSFLEAVQIYEKKDEYIEILAAFVHSYSGKKIAIWCANDLCKSFLEGYEKSYGTLNALFVDEDERKSSFLQGKIVYTSRKAQSNLKGAEYIFIFSPIRYKAIKKCIKEINPSVKIYYIDDLYQSHLL